MNLMCEENRDEFCCGVNNIGGFGYSEDDDNYFPDIQLTDIRNEGTGLITCAFVVGNAYQEEIHAKMMELYDLLFQSEEYTNYGTYAGRDEKGNRNKIVYCVFRHKGAPK